MALRRNGARTSVDRRKVDSAAFRRKRFRYAGIIKPVGALVARRRWSKTEIADSFRSARIEQTPDDQRFDRATVPATEAMDLPFTTFGMRLDFDDLERCTANLTRVVGFSRVR